MIFVSNQLTAKPTPDFEQQFAAYTNLTQSLSEEFDRAAELQAQALQMAWESWGEFCNDLSIMKDPQEFFIRSTTQAHTFAGQSQQFLHEMVALNQQVQEIFLALGQAISPMLLNSVVEFTPTQESDAKLLKDINPVQTIAPKTTQRKPRAAAAKVARITETEISTPTPKARQVKPTKKTAVNPSSEPTSATSETTSVATTTPVKKSVVVGLPSKPVAKSGFAGVSGQPDYKAKSSKATGAKKRVRQ